jgi:hypothetical protein
VTEEEAKTKWCPHVRVAISQTDGRGNIVGHTVANRLDTHLFPFHSSCIGSACMAWRWALEPDPNFKPTHPMMDTYPRNPATDPSPWKASTTNGYCGLAGRL